MTNSAESGAAVVWQRERLALRITIVALLLLAIFQTVGVARDHFTLVRMRAAQQPTVEQGLKVRAQLQTLAGKTAELANSGDAAAREVLDLMQREGVNITPPKHSQKP
ncbi:MAG TPA: hypothetical protein VFK29_04705 [Rhodanobacteraceae bacterium]|jgi:hypothetical protein|nr:hypothetical protein [Rhodanobacteraceae bacterium]